MKKVSTGRFERLECEKCGAHLRVLAPATASARCEVCGSAELRPVVEQRRSLRGVAGDQPDRAQRR